MINGLQGGVARPDLKMILLEKRFDAVTPIAGLVLPEATVDTRNGRLRTIPVGQDTTETDDRRAQKGTFKRIEFVDDSLNFDTYEHGNEVPVDRVQELENAQFFDMENVAALISRNRLLINQEIRVAKAVLNETTFAAAADYQAASAKWQSAPTTATPFVDIDNAWKKLRAKMDVSKNMCAFICNEHTIELAIRTNDVRDYVKYTGAVERMSMDQKVDAFRQYLGVGKIIVGSANKNTASIGVSPASFSAIWQEDLGMLAIMSPAVQNLNMAQGGLGYQPVWNKFSPDYRVESYYTPETDTSYIRTRSYRGEYVNKKFGVLLTNLA